MSIITRPTTPPRHGTRFATASAPVTEPDSPVSAVSPVSRFFPEEETAAQTEEPLPPGVGAIGRCPQCGGRVVGNEYYAGGKLVTLYQCYDQISSNAEIVAHGWNIPYSEVIR